MQLLRMMFAVLVQCRVHFFVVTFGFQKRAEIALLKVLQCDFFPPGSIVGRDSHELQQQHGCKLKVVRSRMNRLNVAPEDGLLIDDVPENLIGADGICSVYCPGVGGLSSDEIQEIIDSYSPGPSAAMRPRHSAASPTRVLETTPRVVRMQPLSGNSQSAHGREPSCPKRFVPRTRKERQSSGENRGGSATIPLAGTTAFRQCSVRGFDEGRRVVPMQHGRAEIRQLSGSPTPRRPLSRQASLAASPRVSPVRVDVRVSTPRNPSPHVTVRAPIVPSPTHPCYQSRACELAADPARAWETHRLTSSWQKPSAPPRDGSPSPPDPWRLHPSEASAVGRGSVSPRRNTLRFSQQGTTPVFSLLPEGRDALSRGISQPSTFELLCHSIDRLQSYYEGAAPGFEVPLVR